ncbi:MAG TPA: alpha/beta hydrolase [Capsulimonadaceae bacterium]|nr:alpha/beta hydrolase [Capsulimonadaceae bacterium]
MGLATAGSPDGKPVIFLHGWGGCRAVWDSVLAHCPEGLKFLALDLPGTGGSARLPVYTIPALAKWVLDTADRLELSSFMLAGHSMGGNVAACAAGLAPGRVEKLVLVDAALYSDRVHRAKYCLHPVSGHATLALARAGAGALAAMGLVFRDHGRGGHWRPYFRRNRYVVAANSHTGMHSHLKALVAHPFDMRSLPKDLPVLIMHGKRDQVIPFAFAEEMLASRPHNTALIAYPNAMHCPMDTSPARFSRDIAAFLQGGLEAT